MKIQDFHEQLEASDEPLFRALAKLREHDAADLEHRMLSTWTPWPAVEEADRASRSP